MLGTAGPPIVHKSRISKLVPLPVMPVRARIYPLIPGGKHCRSAWLWSPFRPIPTVAGMIVVLVYCLFLNAFTGLNYKLKFNKGVPSTQTDQDYIVLTEGCRILDLAPFDFNMVPFFTKMERHAIDCDTSGRGELVKATKYELYVNESVQKGLELEEIQCCYMPFVKRTDLPPMSEYSKIIGLVANYDIENCTVFWNKTVIKHQFVYVKCYDRRTNVIYHQDYFTFAVENDESAGGSAERKINRMLPGSLDQQDRDYYDVNGDTLRPYSVLIIGFDGMSRLNFERQMPRTMSILREQGGVSLLGYNKVGYNTFPNLMPVLTGRNISEIKDICWPSKYAVLDNCPFIWKTFKDYGYYTAYGEDNPLASTFIFSKSGFREQPVDYYMPPFFHEAETHLKTINFFKHTSVYCVGDKQNSARFVNAVQNFASRFKNKPTFALFWFNGMSHDFLNFPRIYDQLFHDMFSSFKEEGVLDSSIIIAMSDHGIRWGQFRQTFQGFLEERLPLATIVLPASFKKRFPRAAANLGLNTKRLTTPYDLYETMWDIVDVGRLPDRTIVDMNSIRQRGMSLFYPIPETRTCHSAGVPVEFCACDERKPMEENHEIKNFLATKAVSYQNLMLANATQCAKLKLLNVDAVWENVPHFGKESAIKILPLHRDFVLKFTTTPGNGVFEARIRFKLPNQLSIVGVISRLNMYHNDSACVDDEILKLYCYCLPNGEDGN